MNGPPKDYADSGDFNGNSGTAQQVVLRDNAPKWVLLLAIVVSIVALVIAVLGLWMAASAIRDARDAIRDAATAAASAAQAAVRSEIAERRANISEVYAKQVYTELNRLGYPVLTPAEHHPPQPSDNVNKDP